MFKQGSLLGRECDFQKGNAGCRQVEWCLVVGVKFVGETRLKLATLNGEGRQKEKRERETRGKEKGKAKFIGCPDNESFVVCLPEREDLQFSSAQRQKIEIRVRAKVNPSQIPTRASLVPLPLSLFPHPFTLAHSLNSHSFSSLNLFCRA